MHHRYQSLVDPVGYLKSSFALPSRGDLLNTLCPQSPNLLRRTVKLHDAKSAGHDHAKSEAAADTELSASLTVT